MPLHREVQWAALGHPALVARFPGASVYALAARAP
jgi:hypothetical protein